MCRERVLGSQCAYKSCVCVGECYKELRSHRDAKNMIISVLFLLWTHKIQYID